MMETGAVRGLSGLRGTTAQTPYVAQESLREPLRGLGQLRYQDGGEVVAPQVGARLGDIAAAPLSPPGQHELMRIYKEAEMAVQGQHPAPDKALAVFVETFGERMLEQMAAGLKAQTTDEPRMVQGPGGPRDDEVPAKIDNVDEARLSDGEFVMTAAAVEGAGDGDPVAGAERLMRMNEMLSGKGNAASLNVERVA